MIAGIFGTSFFLYATSLYLNKDGSLFVFLSLATVLFYFLDVFDGWSDEHDEEEGASSNPYEEARIAMLTLDYVKAEKLFQTALKERPGDMDVVFQLAVLHKKTGHNDKSKSWLKKYLKQKKHTKWVQDAEKLLGELNSDPSDS